MARKAALPTKRKTKDIVVDGVTIVHVVQPDEETVIDFINEAEADKITEEIAEIQVDSDPHESDFIESDEVEDPDALVVIGSDEEANDIVVTREEYDALVLEEQQREADRAEQNRVWQEEQEARQQSYAMQRAENQMIMELEETGRYPSRYRKYPHSEWLRWYREVSTCILNVPDDHQKVIGLYVEEEADDFYIVKAKKWKLTIKAPKKASAAGKTFTIVDPKSGTQYGGSYGSDSAAQLFADWLYEHAKEEFVDRDFILDLAAQYNGVVRGRLNIRTYKDNGGEIVPAE